MRGAQNLNLQQMKSFKGVFKAWQYKDASTFYFFLKRKIDEKAVYTYWM